MARRWGFPVEIIYAIEHHHTSPIERPTPTLDAVVVANLVAKTIGTGLGAEGMDLRLDDQFDRRLRLDFAAFSRVSMQTLTWLKEVKATYGVSPRAMTIAD